MTNSTITSICKKVISKQGLTLEELNELIIRLSSLYEDEQALRLRKIYPHKELIIAMLWDTMHANHLTRRQFAEKLGISYDQLGALLHGQNRISINTARRLLKFGIEANFILRNY
jgi:transcriptional regulator with XRE-family HTH domain